MTSTKLIGSVVAVFAVFTGAYFFISPIATRFLDAQFAEEMAESDQQQVATTTQQETVPASTSTDAQPVAPQPVEPKPIPKPVTPSPVTPTPVTPTPVTAGYTKEEVAQHATESSCWSIVNGYVYDLTSYVSKHPGGSRNILKICGKDGTSAFEGQHGGESRPERTLEGYKIGPLK
jgi:cytochrome b involved in lipid metabolism